VQPEVNANQPTTTSGEMKIAVDANDVDKIISLVKGGESPNSVGEAGGTAIMWALEKGKLRSAKALFGLGADLSGAATNGANVLHCAAEGGDLECVKWVFAKTSINVNSTNNYGDTPVMNALGMGMLEAAKELFKREADLLIVTNNEMNVLHHAAEGGDLECVKWVFAKTSIDVNSIVDDSDTPVMSALCMGKLEAAKELFKR
jgi:ankyrin repeat protein